MTTILILAIFLRAIMSWFPVDPHNPLIQILIQITEPILGPLRQIVPRIGMIDLTPMIAIFVLVLIQRAVVSAV